MLEHQRVGRHLIHALPRDLTSGADAPGLTYADIKEAFSGCINALLAGLGKADPKMTLRDWRQNTLFSN